MGFACGASRCNAGDQTLVSTKRLIRASAQRMLPAELAKRLEQVLLTSAGYELLERPGDGSSLGAFALSLRITSPARSDEELPTATATSGCNA